MGIFVLVLAFGLLVCNWWVGEQEVRTKLIVTGVYVATWLLILVGLLAVIGAQAIFAIVVGAMTFGFDWLMKQH